jgi:ribosomal protein S1
MKRLAMGVLVAMAAVAPALAHGKPEQVLGTVTTITDKAVTIQTTDKKTRTIATNAKTMVMRGTEHRAMKDVKVGDRVVVEVDTVEAVAQTIKLGSAPATPAAGRAAPTAAAAQPHAEGHR